MERHTSPHNRTCANAGWMSHRNGAMVPPVAMTRGAQVAIHSTAPSKGSRAPVEGNVPINLSCEHNCDRTSPSGEEQPNSPSTACNGNSLPGFAMAMI
eukprot:4305372-Lingulodinium_polyedra.AAC.2